MTLALTDLTCVRGERTLFRDLDFEIGSGEAALVRGANGSGKTSLLRLIAGLLKPQSGTVVWSKVSEDQPLQSQLHFLGHLDAIKPAMSVEETVAFWSAMKGGSRDVSAALKQWNLEALASLPCGILSAGQRRRVALAQLDAAPRPLWLLDEPTGPLDEAGVELVTQAVARHQASGGTVLVATHRTLDLGQAKLLDLSASNASNVEAAS